MEHEFFKVGAAVLGGEAEDVSKFYSSSRYSFDLRDDLETNVRKDQALEKATGIRLLTDDARLRFTDARRWSVGFRYGMESIRTTNLQKVLGSGV